MAKKPVKKYDYKPYPKHDGLRSGCKVSWYYYKDRADADAAAIVARHNALIQQELGYDFGYCWPGSVHPAHENSKHAGLWEVCIP